MRMFFYLMTKKKGVVTIIRIFTIFSMYSKILHDMRLKQLSLDSLARTALL